MPGVQAQWFGAWGDTLELSFRFAPGQTDSIPVMVSVLNTGQKRVRSLAETIQSPCPWAAVTGIYMYIYTCIHQACKLEENICSNTQCSDCRRGIWSISVVVTMISLIVFMNWNCCERTMDNEMFVYQATFTYTNRFGFNSFEFSGMGSRLHMQQLPSVVHCGDVSRRFLSKWRQHRPESVKQGLLAASLRFAPAKLSKL